jgi:hypothetical protein
VHSLTAYSRFLSCCCCYLSGFARPQAGEITGSTLLAKVLAAMRLTVSLAFCCAADSKFSLLLLPVISSHPQASKMTGCMLQAKDLAAMRLTLSLGLPSARYSYFLSCCCCCLPISLHTPRLARSRAVRCWPRTLLSCVDNLMLLFFAFPCAADPYFFSCCCCCCCLPAPLHTPRLARSRAARC